MLHVDDEPDFAALTAEFLKREDDRFELETAPTAEAGLNRLAETNFDCVIADFEMPGQTGIEFLEAVRDRYPDLPFILFTGKGSEEVASDAITAGVSDYLHKHPGPEQFTLLANRVKNAIEQYHAKQRLTEAQDRFQTLVEEATDVMLIVAPDGQIKYATPSAERILGRTPNELVGTNGFAPIHPDDTDAVKATFAELAAQPTERRSAEFRYKRPDESYIWVEARGRNLVNDPVIDGIVVYVRDTTERKHRELELQKTERRYQAIFNDPNILVGLLDTDGTVEDINETAFEYIDAELDDVVGQPFWETPWFTHSTRVQAEIKDWIEQARQGEYIEFEVELARPNGEPYTIQGVFRPVHDADGEVVSLIVSDREITERKDRERELERIRDFFTEAERLGNLGAWEFNAAGEVVWTAGTRRIHEVDDEYDPTLEDGIKFFHPDDQDRLRDVVDAALEQGEAFDVEARLITATGRERWVRTRGKPLADEAGTVRGYIQDITTRKKREQELDRAKSQLEAAVAAGAVGTWQWHVQEDRLVVGQEFARTFGVDPDDAREGVPLERFTSSIHEEDRARVEQKIEAALAACGEYEAEYRVYNAAEELRWVVARGEVECNDAGEPVRFPGSLIDITDRKAAEEELKRQNERLDEFASVVSHDLRNPLHVAKGQLELVREECESERLDAIGRAHDRMEALIDDLLSLARGDESPLEIESVDIDAVLDESWASVEDSTATLELEVDRRIQCDPDRVRQLFENLFRNAIEHGGEGVRVRVGALADGFFVEDDGPGIPEAEREKVFEAGYSTAPEGTGFGLSIVQQVVEAHDWSIRVTDGEAGGARFEITGVTWA